MPFSHLIGHDPIKALLKHKVATHTLSHTLLFHGPKGLGKTQFALETAKLLMGPSHAHKIASGHHPDLHHLYPEGKTAKHSAESLRSWMEEEAMTPFEAPCKVFIIHDAEEMLPSSSNSLLKTLEEPSPDTYIFLISSKPHEILPTILSRSYKIPFFPLKEEEIVQYLMTKKHLAKEEAEKLAYHSSGSLDQLEVFFSEKQRKMRSLLYTLLGFKLPFDYHLFMDTAEKLEELLTPEKEGEKHGGYQLLEEIFAYKRDLVLLQTAPHLPLYHQEARELLVQQARNQKIDLEKSLEKIELGKLALSRHVKLKVVLAEIFG